MTADEMTCKQVTELVTEYLEGTLPERDRAEFESHLTICPDCVTYIEQMRQTVRVVGKLKETSLPPDFMDRFLVAFQGWKAKQE